MRPGDAGRVLLRECEPYDCTDHLLIAEVPDRWSWRVTHGAETAREFSIEPAKPWHLRDDVIAWLREVHEYRRGRDLEE